MALCSHVKRDGKRCRAVAMRSSGLCPAHDPSTQAARLAGQRKGGKASRHRPYLREMEGIKARLWDVTDRALAGEVVPAAAAIGVQGLNALLRASEQARRWAETVELAERMDELERRVDGHDRRGGERSA